MAITEDQARDAMLQFVSEHCCYGKAPAEEMVIKDVIPSSAYHVSRQVAEIKAPCWILLTICTP